MPRVLRLGSEKRRCPSGEAMVGLLPRLSPSGGEKGEWGWATLVGMEAREAERGREEGKSRSSSVMFSLSSLQSSPAQNRKKISATKKE